MNANPPDNLEARLSALTEPTDEPPRLWQAALAEHRATPRRAVLGRISAVVGIAAVILLFLGGVILPSLGKARRNAMPERFALESQAEEAPSAEPGGRSLAAAEQMAAMNRARPSAARPGALWQDHSGPVDAVSTDPWMKDEMAKYPDAASVLGAPRLVARRADMTLRVPDVREAFLKAGQLVSPVRGEFVEDSKIAGEGAGAAADLTLRVAADRLAEALNELRALGEVAAENSSGDDVTDQAIDLDARLRNERRVEEELLELLHSRKDAPLADILRLRESLSSVRANIERMAGQRDALARRVDLATVLVLIRAKDARPGPPPNKGLASYFQEQVLIAWRQATIQLADTLALLLRLAVGRLPTWIALLIALPFVIRAVRWLARVAALEPAPRLG